MPDFSQPDQHFSLQEVAQRCGLAPYIICYWEIHFPQLAGQKGSPKSSYTSNDVALIWRIKKLLYVDHLTIDQAKAQLAKEQAFPVQYPGGASAPHADIQDKPLEPAAEQTTVEAIPQVEASGQNHPGQQMTSADVLASDEAPAVQKTLINADPQNAEQDRQKIVSAVESAQLQELRARVQELTHQTEVLRDARESLMHENENLKRQLQGYEDAQQGIEATQSTLAEENVRLKKELQEVLSQLKQISCAFKRK